MARAHLLLLSGLLLASLLAFSPYVAAQTLPGDFNGDGLVDIRDYGVWRQNFGQTNCGNPADANGDCLVDIRDYGIWRDNFGRTSATATPTIGVNLLPSTATPTVRTTPTATRTATPSPTQTPCGSPGQCNHLTKTAEPTRTRTPCPAPNPHC